MKLKFGAIIVDGSGKIGGQVVSSNRGGKYLRTKVTPSNPSTVAQQDARALLSSLSTAWADLTEAQRLSFNNAVASYATTDIFGDIKNPSGFNLFVKLNANLSITEQANLNTAPTKIEVPYSQFGDALCDLSTSVFALSFGDGNYDGLFAFVTATPSMSQGISNSKSKMRGIGFVTITAGQADIYDAYVAKFGIPAAGANIVIGVEIVVATGQKSVKQTVKARIQA